MLRLGMPIFTDTSRGETDMLKALLSFTATQRRHTISNNMQMLVQETVRERMEEVRNHVNQLISEYEESTGNSILHGGGANKPTRQRAKNIKVLGDTVEAVVSVSISVRLDYKASD